MREKFDFTEKFLDKIRKDFTIIKSNGEIEDFFEKKTIKKKDWITYFLNFGKLTKEQKISILKNIFFCEIFKEKMKKNSIINFLFLFWIKKVISKKLLYQNEKFFEKIIFYIFDEIEIFDTNKILLYFLILQIFYKLTKILSFFHKEKVLLFLKIILKKTTLGFFMKNFLKIQNIIFESNDFIIKNKEKTFQFEDIIYDYYEQINIFSENEENFPKNIYLQQKLLIESNEEEKINNNHPQTNLLIKENSTVNCFANQNLCVKINDEENLNYKKTNLLKNNEKETFYNYLRLIFLLKKIKIIYKFSRSLSKIDFKLSFIFLYEFSCKNSEMILMNVITNKNLSFLQLFFFNFIKKFLFHYFKLLDVLLIYFPQTLKKFNSYHFHLVVKKILIKLSGQQIEKKDLKNTAISKKKSFENSDSFYILVLKVFTMMVNDLDRNSKLNKKNMKSVSFLYTLSINQELILNQNSLSENDYKILTKFVKNVKKIFLEEN